MKYDVVIVGMGPVGMTMACLLGHAGLNVAVLDRELAIYDKPRAIVLDHEALRTLQFCGIDSHFFEGVSPHTGTDFLGEQGQLIKLFDPKAPPFELGWPPNVMFIQPDLENALARAAADLSNVKTFRGVNVVAVEQGAEWAAVVAEGPDGQRSRFEAAWVVGADGANSVVRSAGNLPMDDLGFAEWWVVVDAWLTREAKLPEKTTQFCQSKRPATYVVGPGNLRRWEIKMLPGEEPEAFRSEAAVRDLLSGYVDVEALNVWRSAVYRFRAAVAGRWRHGRLLIAGDAAHTMPPFLAQGLCAGMRDAANLAWKMTQVVMRGTDPSLLDSYEAERRPHVSRIIEHAMEFGLIIGELDPERAAKRDEELSAQLKNGSVPTERQAFVPPLRGGLIETNLPAAGSLFVQPRTDAGVLMDDILEPEFLIVSSDPDALAIEPELADRWASSGGLIVIANRNPAFAARMLPIRDPGESVHRSLEKHGSTSALVRPDRYVHGMASNTDDLSRMIESVLASLAGPS